MEDFSTYIKVDPSSHITRTSSRVTAVAVGRNEDAYSYDDKGVNHFDGDFIHKCTVYHDALSDNNSSVTMLWALANTIDDAKGIANGSGNTLHFYFTSDVAFPGECRLFLREVDGGSLYLDSTAATGVLVDDTPYYLKIERDESIGTYGTIYIYIYSNSDRTDLIDVLSIALHTSKKDYRYIYAIQSWNDGSAFDFYGYIENLDLMESAPTLLLTGVG